MDAHTKRRSRLGLVAVAIVGFLLSSGCLPYIYHERDRVLVEAVDVDQTLDVAERDLEDGGFGSVLTVWALRDQEITPQQAERISDLYFRFVSNRENGGFFNIWHLTWAISNYYRLGDDDVRSELEGAYRDAAARVEDLDSSMATTHFSDDQLYMGDAHALGRAFARSRIVAPGNELFLQSAHEVR